MKSILPSAILPSIFSVATTLALPLAFTGLTSAQDQATYMPPVHVAPPQSVVERIGTSDEPTYGQQNYGQQNQVSPGGVQNAAYSAYTQPASQQPRSVQHQLGDSPRVPIASSEQIDAARAMHVAQLAAQMRMQNQAAMAMKEARINAAGQANAPVYPYPTGYNQQPYAHQPGFNQQAYNQQVFNQQAYAQRVQPTYAQPQNVNQRTPTPVAPQANRYQTGYANNVANAQANQNYGREVDQNFGLQGKIASFLKRTPTQTTGRTNRTHVATNRQVRQPKQARPQPRRHTSNVADSMVVKRLPPKQTAQSRTAPAIGSGIRNAQPENQSVSTHRQPKIKYREPDRVRQAVAMNETDDSRPVSHGAYIDSTYENDGQEIQLTAQETTDLYGLDTPPRLAQQSPRINSPRASTYSGQQNGSLKAKPVSVFGDWQDEDDSTTTNNNAQDFQSGRSNSPFKSADEIERELMSEELPERSMFPDQDPELEDEARRARRNSFDAAESDEIDEIDEPDDELDLDDIDDERSDTPRPTERSCDEFRDLLLNSSIKDISLDISPPASSRRNEQVGISRNWTDRNGNVLATGTMVDLRRGYVILDSGQKLAYGRLSESDWAAISDYWLLPTICGIGSRGSTYRSWTPQTVTWKASGLCHKPLYFENIQLERYGHSRGPVMQPIQSTVHFFRSLVTIPYQTSVHPANECQYALGFYRPGNCAPWLVDPISVTEKGLKRQALFAVGAAFIP